MLDINFLKRPNEFRLDGQEFMDYQKGDLFKDLSTFLEKEISKEKTDSSDFNGKTSIADFDALHDGIQDIFMTHTGILFDLQTDMVSNAAVDSGWFSPGNLLNIKGIEQFFSARQSNIGNAFKVLKTDILKGWVDTSTGKVGGDYSKIKFNLYLNFYLEYIFDNKLLKRFNVTLAEALAGALIHESGHVFTGFLFITRNVIDPIISTTAVKMITEGNVYGKERVNIIREAFKVMEIGQKVEESDVATMTGEALVIYFNKAVGTRDTRRSLSLGTQDRASEIYADLYATRMGCPKSLVAALASSPEMGMISPKMVLNSTYALIAGLLSCSPILAFCCTVGCVLTIYGFMRSYLVPGDVYESPYRRLKIMLRDYVVQLNSKNGPDKRDKVKMLADAKEMEKIIDDAKPFLEGTMAQRIASYMTNGSDFRAQEFEHYNEELIGHTLSLYKETF